MKTLQFNLVKEMVNKYRSTQLRAIETAPVNPVPNDAHSLWLSLKDLKDFIETIEKEVAKNPQLPVVNPGIRFYYTAYPKSEVWQKTGYEDIADMTNDPVAKNYQDKHTLVAIPTMEKNGTNYDFDPSNPATYGGATPPGGFPGTEVMAMNHGQLIPPKSSLGEWF